MGSFGANFKRVYNLTVKMCQAVPGSLGSFAMSNFSLEISIGHKLYNLHGNASCDKIS